MSGTHVVVPEHFLYFWVGIDVALKVHVVAFLDVLRVEVAAHLESHHRLVWRRKRTTVNGGDNTRVCDSTLKLKKNVVLCNCEKEKSTGY